MVTYYTSNFISAIYSILILVNNSNFTLFFSKAGCHANTGTEKKIQSLIDISKHFPKDFKIIS